MLNTLKVALIAASIGAIALADTLWNPANRAIAQPIETQNSSLISNRAADLNTPITPKCSGTSQVLPLPPAIANSSAAEVLPVPSAAPCIAKFFGLERTPATGESSGNYPLPIREIRLPEGNSAAVPGRSDRLELRMTF